jgi:hypothetical protein
MTMILCFFVPFDIPIMNSRIPSDAAINCITGRTLVGGHCTLEGESDGFPHSQSPRMISLRNPDETFERGKAY